MTPSGRRKFFAADAGAALVTVIMMVAIMGALGAAAFEAANLSLRRTSAQSEMGQTRWYLLGAEAYATGLISRAMNEDTASRVADAWLDQAVTLPLDDGLMEITVWDGSNCFNLNSVAQRAETGQLFANQAGMARYALLLEVLGVQNSQGLAAALADWIDADDAPLPGGAEALMFSASAGARPPANTLLSDVGELRHVTGYTPDVIERLKGRVCVRPVAAPNVLNINTLTSSDAFLLSAVTGRVLPVSAAERVIAERPIGGWTSVDEFLAVSTLAGLGLSDETKALFSRSSQWYVVGVRVRYRDAYETSVSLIATEGGHSRLVRRIFGAGARKGVL